MVCKRCGSTNGQFINEMHSKGKDVSFIKACLGVVCIGPIGILCGFCGEGRVVTSQNYWICKDCGAKVKANEYDN